MRQAKGTVAQLKLPFAKNTRCFLCDNLAFMLEYAASAMSPRAANHVCGSIRSLELSSVLRVTSSSIHYNYIRPRESRSVLLNEMTSTRARSKISAQSFRKTFDFCILEIC